MNANPKAETGTKVIISGKECEEARRDGERQPSINRLLLRFTAVALVLGGTTVMPNAFAADDTTNVRAADCAMYKAIEARAKQAAAESRDSATKSSEYIRGEKDKAESEKKNGHYEILADFKRTGWKMDVPEVTVRSGEIQVPTIHVTVGTTSFNVPVPSQCKIGSTKIPEFRDLRMTWKEHDILAPCMTTKQVKIDLPQFTAGTTSIHVPQITVEMKTREFSLDLPQFTERTPDHEMRKHEDNIAQEEGRLASTLASIDERNIAAATKEVLAVWQTEHDAAVQAIDAAEKKTLDDIAAARLEVKTKMTAAQAALRNAGAPANLSAQLEQQSQQANAALDLGESQANEMFAQMRARLKNEFDELKRKYLEPGAATGAASCQG
jgi:hypothetical protein